MNTVIQRGHIQLIKAASKDIYSVIKYIYSACCSLILQLFNFIFFLINLPHNDSENRILEMSLNLLKRKNWNISFT